jgi:hypothetical protein
MRRFEPVLGAVNPYARVRLTRLCFLTLALTAGLTVALAVALIGAGTTLVL